MSTDLYTHDVFLSYSSKDKTVVRTIAERLRADGLRVWFDDWELKPGDSIPAKIEQGLEQSRVLVLCLSANALGSNWAALESGTFRFRDPLNKERRFIPLRLDDAPIKGSLGQFVFINWFADGEKQEYRKLLEACRPIECPTVLEVKARNKQFARKIIRLQCNFKAVIYSYAFSQDGNYALTASSDYTVRLWELGTGQCFRVFRGHTGAVWKAVWSTDQRYVLSCGSFDRTMRLWDAETGQCLLTLKGHTDAVVGGAWSTDQQHVLSCSWDNTLRLWDVSSMLDSSIETGNCLNVFEGHLDSVFDVVYSFDQRLALSCSGDNTVRLWDISASINEDVESGRCLRVFEGHTDRILCLAWSANQRYALSGSEDNTVRLWDIPATLNVGVETGRCLRVFEGHTSAIFSVAWSSNQRYALSGSSGRPTLYCRI